MRFNLFCQVHGKTKDEMFSWVRAWKDLETENPPPIFSVWLSEQRSQWAKETGFLVPHGLTFYEAALYPGPMRDFDKWLKERVTGDTCE